MRKIQIARWAGMLAVAFLLLPLSACDEILKVNNPDEINVDTLNDAQLFEAQVAGVVSEFLDELTRNNGALLWSANFLTDEQVTGLNWEDYARVNQRIVNYTEGPVASLWGGISRWLRLGKHVIELSDSLVDDPGSSEYVALAEVYIGYGYLYAGESMCMTVFSDDVDNPSGDVLTPNETFALAIPHFLRAIQVGTAAGTPDLANLARVGLARTYLNLGDNANTITYAQQVPSGFTYWAEFSDRQDAENNGLYGEVHGSNFTMGVSPFFLQGTFGTQDLIDTQTDPRIQHASRWRTGHNALTKLYKPYQGLRFSEYSGETLAPPSVDCPACTGATEGNGDNGDVLLYQKYTKIVMADELEARHHMYEAMARQGGNDAAVLAFVNERRAVGNQAPVSLSGAALFAELRNQRGRDTYQGGLRLGDLRRWSRLDGVDLFPSGNHVNVEWGAYGEWTCYPLPLEEYEGNDNLQKPADPLTPPPGI
jgi:hypothetical protein